MADIEIQHVVHVLEQMDVVVQQPRRVDERGVGHEGPAADFHAEHDIDVRKVVFQGFHPVVVGDAAGLDAQQLQTVEIGQDIAEHSHAVVADVFPLIAQLFRIVVGVQTVEREAHGELCRGSGLVELRQILKAQGGIAVRAHGVDLAQIVHQREIQAERSDAVAVGGGEIQRLGRIRQRITLYRFLPGDAGSGIGRADRDEPVRAERGLAQADGRDGRKLFGGGAERFQCEAAVAQLQRFRVDTHDRAADIELDKRGGRGRRLGFCRGDRRGDGVLLSAAGEQQNSGQHNGDQQLLFISNHDDALSFDR